MMGVSLPMDDPYQKQEIMDIIELVQHLPLISRRHVPCSDARQS